ncbi:glycosyltransferase [Bacteroidales bacterium OttesenSCG-928-B11]|nr:glycosyltransferase [Bacteroidales bacterium OttesenSCG-928-E04]MDL2312542.1 glycosyltransferase [Bacteroidales bacterium OttesenSCG-928-B11]MDL2326499.1 glycosyltransferase [Bacteroidales bacterium OttesenSCG-928-A14]
MKKLISILTPCYNEEENVEEVYRQVKEVFAGLPEYRYEHIFIDNSSKDKTQELLRGIAEEDKNVKLILNSRNFGHLRSPYYGLLQANGDAVILFVADLQDPPSMIPEFIKKWEEGFKIVVGVKNESEESKIFFAIRKIYYNIVQKFSEIELIKNYTGFGLYDKKIIEILRTIPDNYPFFRGLICEIGFEKAIIHYKQPVRKRGFTKNNLYTLYDIGILGITTQSKVPLRLAIFTGLIMAVISFVAAIVYFILKLIFWDSMPMGMAPLVMGFFFFSSVQLFFIGVIGEYIGNIHTQTLRRPLVIEKERVNFEEDETINDTKKN